MGQHSDHNQGPVGDPDPERPAGPPNSGDSPASPASGGPTREELLAGFAKGGQWDARAPGSDLAVAVATAAGPGWRCKGASGEQMIGILNRIAALEAWCAAGKLGVIREVIRDDDPAFLCKSRHGNLPDVWEPALAHEVALALAASATSADKTMQTAWQLGARLPEINTLLENGVIDAGKARLIIEVFAELSDENAGRAEAMLVAELIQPPAKTYAQVERAATAIALIVDPHLGEARRKAAEQRAARVQCYRERAGTAALEGRDLPTDQTLAAYASVNARARQYKESGVFGKARMDQLRATAYLDLLNRVSAEARIAHGLLSGQEPDPDPTPEDVGDPGRPGGDDCPCQQCNGACLPPDDSPDEPDPDDPSAPSAPGDNGPDDDPGDDGSDGRGPDDCGPDDGGPDGPGPGDSNDPADLPDGPHPGPGGNDPDSHGPDDTPPRDTDPPGHGNRPALQSLTLPLATLTGLAGRPGEGHALGALDPALCRTIAATAMLSPHTVICLTITNNDGIAIGHGCARPPRAPRAGPATTAPPHHRRPPPLVALPSRINLTVTEQQLRKLTGQSKTGWAIAPRGTGPPVPLRPSGPSGPSDLFALHTPPGSFIPPGRRGDPDWCRAWNLTLPDGRLLTVELEPVPTYDCDHRHESHAYQPNDRLRHLVQIRDHVCTFPTCNRHARDSDFEHAVPYDKGGRTCACNAGARSRQCHRVKQSPGWNVTQPKPGWHQWTTPRGRTYTQGPNRYPI